MRRILPVVISCLLCTCAAISTPDAEEDIEGRTGRMLVRGFDNQVRELSYVVRHGRAIHGDDFDLGPVDASMLRTRGYTANISFGHRWADNTVYYDYSTLPAGCPSATDACACEFFGDTDQTCTNLLGTETMGERATVRAALDEYEALTGLHFVKGAVAGKPYITFGHRPGSGTCYGDAYNNNQGFPVMVTVGATFSERTILHEVGHALGFIHEQERPDADDNINFAPVCMEQTEVFEFSNVNQREYLTAFDFDSVMIYQSDSRSITKTTCDWENPTSSDCCPSMLRKTGTGTSGYHHYVYAASSYTFRGNTYFYFPQTTAYFAGYFMELTPDLSAEDLNALWQMYPVALDSAEGGDRMGTETATGDFNDDGYMDLAVGAPKEGLGTHATAGAVFLYRGTYTGLMPWRVIEEDPDGTGAESDDRFGSALAGGDLNHDGIDDLVVGAKNKRNGSNVPGAIYVFLGDPGRTGLILHDRILPSNLGYGEYTDDDFGYALDVAHVMDVTGVTDAQQVVVGAPGSALGTGRVYLLKWSDTQATYTGSSTGTLVLQYAMTSPSGVEFGKAVRAGKLDSDSLDDIVVGAPGGVINGGQIAIFKGGASLVPLGVRVEGIPTGSNLGHSLRLGRFRNSSGKRQIAVGVPDYGSGGVFVYDVTLNSSSFTVNSSQFLQQSSNYTDNDRFGLTLSAGDLDDDGITDLAVGSSEDDRDGLTNVGSVWLFHGVSSSTPALAAWGSKITLPSSYGTQATGDNFGAALTIANFDNQGPGDLAIGMPGQSSDTGAFVVMHGRTSNTPVFSSDTHAFTTYLKQDSQSSVRK